MDETNDVAVEEQEVPELPANHPGVPDGYVDADGDTVVYEYEDGELVGWHKEPAA